MIKTAKKIQKTTKKMVDDVFLKLVGMRVLERAKAMTEVLKKENKVETKKTSSKKSSARKVSKKKIAVKTSTAKKSRKKS